MKLIALIFITVVTVAAQDQRKQLDTLRAEGYDALYNLLIVHPPATAGGTDIYPSSTPDFLRKGLVCRH
jgi:hypothetical protein